MAWNEPGDNNKDPWGKQGPPDLDEVIQKIQDKLGGIFGGGGSSNDDGKSDNGGNYNPPIGLILLFIVLIWGMFGIYTVQPAEVGVVTRFGKYHETTQQGLNWRIPYPIEQVQKVNVQEVRPVTHKALMLTEDENIVEIEVIVQYRVVSAKDYLFNVTDPDDTLRQATESSLREVVGTSKMDGVLTSERTRVSADTKKLIQEIVDRYETGLTVINVNMQNAQPPAEVQSAFEDVIKAREDQERSKNKAQAYSNEVIEKVKGAADKLRQEAQAYKAQVIARSEGETKRFLSVLTEYEKAPEVTRQRLYLETMESVLSKTSKVILDVNSSNNLMVLPLDKLIGNRVNNSQIPLLPNSQKTTRNQQSRNNVRNNDARNRGGR
ncbi:FtsH protease activity modulator HflK [Candidatus Halobeggiatoa sp. HSG11]|nr:FtsH protease activity modulator HflK [Candidatus Halobeggiatoa sp. HSG11]